MPLARLSLPIRFLLSLAQVSLGTLALGAAVALPALIPLGAALAALALFS